MRARIAWRLEDWPAADQNAWRRATEPPDSPFDAGYAASRLRPRSLTILVQVWGLWLAHLAAAAALDASGVDAVTPAQLDAFVAAQRQRGKGNYTIRKRCEGLHSMLRLLAPGRDFGFLLRPGGMPLARALPHRARRPETRHVAELMQRVQALHRDGLAGRAYAGGMAGLRDAALLGILTMRAPRVGSLAAMRLGHHLRRTEAGYEVWFDEQDTKTGERLHYTVEGPLLQILDDYLNIARPRLGGRDTDWLWLGTRGRALNAHALEKIVRRRTRDWFGVERGPHWFRKCLATTAATVSPEMALDAAAVLGHSPQTSLRHYNLAIAEAAATRHNARIHLLRRETAALAERLFSQRTSLR